VLVRWPGNQGRETGRQRTRGSHEVLEKTVKRKGKKKRTSFGLIDHQTPVNFVQSRVRKERNTNAKRARNRGRVKDKERKRKRKGGGATMES